MSDVRETPTRCPPLCLSCLHGAGLPHEVHHGRLANTPSPAAAFLLVDLHADSAAAHDFITSDGSFERTLAFLAEAKSTGQAVEVRTWLTRATYRHLRAVPRHLKDAQVRVWHIHALPYSSPTPRLAMAWPHALRAAKVAQGEGIQVTTHGAPRCVLGPFAHLAGPEPAQAFGDKCARCAARAQCSGVDAGYLARFGDEDLRALR